MNSATFSTPVAGLLVLLSILSLTHAQFPRVCAKNATTEDGVCCPIPPEPCGGAGRGSCKLIPENDDRYATLNAGYENDDRLNWPHRFFHHACSCQGNFFGYMCHECAFGYRGENCDIKHIAIRKDATKLTKGEQEQFRRVVSHSKTVQSDYVVLTNVYDQDPSTNPVFTDVSVYDYFAFAHQYASRNTVLRGLDNQPTKECPISNGLSSLDFAHTGSAFPTWHRLLMLLWERALQKASREEDFTFPYWDWVDLGDCNVCINELVGATNMSDPAGHLDSRSPFSNWISLCQLPSTSNNFCYLCEPDQPGDLLSRRIRNGAVLPDKRQVDYALSLPDYDLPPYDLTSPRESFRNVHFGTVGEEGTKPPLLHGQGHSFFVGPMSSVPNAVSDPLFILHHTFVDKLFEMWLRKYRPDKKEMPEQGSRPGHNRNAYLVPFFPVQVNVDYFVDSKKLGFDFDDMNEHQSASLQSQFLDANEPEMEAGDAKTSTWVLSLVLGAVVLAILVVGALFVIRRNRRSSTDRLETTPLLKTGKA